MKQVVGGLRVTKDCFISEDVDARDLEFGLVEDGVLLPFKGFVEEVEFHKEGKDVFLEFVGKGGVEVVVKFPIECGWPKEWEKLCDLDRVVSDTKYCVGVVDENSNSEETPVEMVRTRSGFQIR